jgi:hypothetical protein
MEEKKYKAGETIIKQVSPLSASSTAVIFSATSLLGRRN